MKTNQLYPAGCLKIQKFIAKFYLGYLIALEISMKLKDLLIKLKALLVVK